MADYDPLDVAQFYGRTFISSHGSCYTVTENGKISGRPSIEGADIEYIAGMYFNKIKQKDAERLVILERSRDVFGIKELVDCIIKEYGEMPREGLGLVLTLTTDSVKRTSRWGLKVELIERIE